MLPCTTASRGGVPAAPICSPARSGAGRLTREASHDAPTIYKRRKMKSGHYFERFFCGRWKWLITKLMRCNFFDYFSKSAGIFGSKAGEIYALNRRGRAKSDKVFSEFNRRGRELESQ